MGRRRERFTAELENGGGGGEEEEGEEEDGEDGTSAEELEVSADAGLFDTTFVVSSDDEPFGVGERPAIPRPWQGIPRIAIVYNLNFVWDDDSQEWVKKSLASLIIDDFEDGDISEYGGDTGPFDVIVDKDDAQDGNRVLTWENGGNSVISSTSGLGVYPEPGDSFRGYFKSTATPSSDLSTHSALVWGMSSEVGFNNRDGYAVQLRGQETRLVRYDSGNTVELDDDTNFTLRQDTWFKVLVNWGTDGKIVVNIEDLDDAGDTRLEATDTTHTGSGIGWAGNHDSGTEQRYDRARLES